MSIGVPKSATPPLRLQLFPQVVATGSPITGPDPNAFAELHGTPKSKSRSRARPETPSRSKTGSPDFDQDPSAASHSVHKRRSGSLPRPSSSRKRSGSSSASAVPLPSANPPAMPTTMLGSGQQNKWRNRPESPNFAQQMLAPLQLDDCVVQISQMKQAHGQPHDNSLSSPESQTPDNSTLQSSSQINQQQSHESPRKPRRPLDSMASADIQIIYSGSPIRPSPGLSTRRNTATSGKSTATRLNPTARLALLNAKEEELKREMKENRRLREQKSQQSLTRVQTDDSQLSMNLSGVLSSPDDGRPIGIATPSPSTAAPAPVVQPPAAVPVPIAAPAPAPAPVPPAEAVPIPAAPPVRSRFPLFDPAAHANVTAAPRESASPQLPPPAYQPAPVRVRTSAVSINTGPRVTIPRTTESGTDGPQSQTTSGPFQSATPGYRLPVDTLSQPSPTQEGLLQLLWDVCNGSLAEPAGSTLQATEVLCFPMLPSIEPDQSGPKRLARPSPIMFGPELGIAPFFSVKQAAFPDPSDPVRPHEREHELIVFRHQPGIRNEVLPVAHVGMVPPPPPDSSTTRSVGLAANSTGPSKTRVCTLAPMLANVQALDAIASTPIGRRLAETDPFAQSAEAQELAARVIAETAARESGIVCWSKTGPATGQYELHHGSFGGHIIVALVSGDFSKTPFGPAGQDDRRIRQAHQSMSGGRQYRFGISDREIAVTLWAPEEMFDQADIAASAAMRQPGSSLDGDGRNRRQAGLSLRLDTSASAVGPTPFPYGQSGRGPLSAVSLTPSAVAAPLVPGLVQAHAAQAPVIATTHRPIACLNASTGNLYLYPNSVMPLLARCRFLFDLIPSTVFVIAAAEGRRGADRGLFFAAPPKVAGTTASSSQTSVSSVFSARVGRESAETTETDADDEPSSKSFLSSIKAKFRRGRSRSGSTGDVEMGSMTHTRHYGAGDTTASSMTMLNPMTGSGGNGAAGSFSPPPGAAGSKDWGRTMQNAGDPNQWSGPLSNMVDGIAGDLGFQTREQKVAGLEAEHAAIVASQKGRKVGRSDRRKANKKAAEVKKAKHSFPTRVVVGSVVMAFRIAAWFFRMLFRLGGMVFRRLEKKDKAVSV